MGIGIRSRIVKIGNSQGIRIPKAVLEQSGIQTEIEIEVQAKQLIIRPAGRSRRGWSEAFAATTDQGDDGLLESETSTVWDDSEWEW